MSSGYAVTNAASGLAASAFTWSSGYTTNRARLNDGLQDELAAGSSSAQASGQTLIIDMGAAVSLSAFALLNHNLATGACYVNIYAASDSGFTTSLWLAMGDTTITTSAPYEKDTILQFEAISRRYWKITFNHTGTKIVTLGELMAITSITTLTRQTVYGAGESERYVQNRVESATGNLRSTFLSGPIRTKSLPFKDLRGTSERNELMTMWRATRGGVSNLLYVDSVASSYPSGDAASQQCLWGKLQESLGWTEDDYLVFGVDGLVLVGQGREVGS